MFCTIFPLKKKYMPCLFVRKKYLAPKKSLNPPNCYVKYDITYIKSNNYETLIFGIEKKKKNNVKSDHHTNCQQ